MPSPQLIPTHADLASVYHRYRATAANRSQLLGADYYTPPSSGRSSPFQAAGHRYVDDLEGQNDEHLDGLAAKVKVLKDVSANLVLAHVTRRHIKVLCTRLV